MQLLGHCQYEGFCPSIDSVRHFRRQGEDRRDVDDATPPAGREALRGGGGKLHGGGNIQLHQGGKLVRVGFGKRAARIHSGVIDEQGNGRIFTQAARHGGKPRGGSEVGGKHFYQHACLRAQPGGAGGEACFVPRRENKVVAALRQRLCIGGTDAAGGAGNQCRALVFL